MGDSPSQAGSHSKCSRKSVLGARGEARHDAGGDHWQSTLSRLPSARLPQLHLNGSQESGAVHQRSRGGSRRVPPGEELPRRVTRCPRESQQDLSILLPPESVQPWLAVGFKSWQDRLSPCVVLRGVFCYAPCVVLPSPWRAPSRPLLAVPLPPLRWGDSRGS